MTVLGWLLAYWALWMLVGSLIMAMRFEDFFEEFSAYRDDPTDEKLAVLLSYIKYLTFWPRKYYLRERDEQRDEDDDEHDDENNGPEAPEE